MRMKAWGLLRISLLIIGSVVAVAAVFAITQLFLKGHVANGQLSLDIEGAITPHKTKRRNHETGPAEPYHYDFFALLDQPAPMRTLPEVSTEQNPALAARAKGVRPGNLKLTGKYAVQVSSFQSAQEAQNLVRELQAQGYLAVIVNETVDGKGWYRVRIDGGKQRQQAEQLQATIQKKTGLKGFVVTL
ncbi:MAG: SPOR domain-containing protein [Proteobacteria bacterium]|nr:SPOR domain-containing protein [Pseudomonadota bacterium]